MYGLGVKVSHTEEQNEDGKTEGLVALISWIFLLELYCLI